MATFLRASSALVSCCLVRGLVAFPALVLVRTPNKPSQKKFDDNHLDSIFEVGWPLGQKWSWSWWLFRRWWSDWRRSSHLHKFYNMPRFAGPASAAAARGPGRQTNSNISKSVPAKWRQRRATFPAGKLFNALLSWRWLGDGSRIR